ncbi:MAG: hypothetical protein GY847_38830 [Proteobacteria bacterium]|nr:hypothetical protein [Pseudomonadota bacterium]
MYNYCDNRSLLQIEILLVALIISLAPILNGCEQEDGTSPRQIVATISEAVSTVVIVNWNTDESTRGYVEYGTTKELGRTTPLEAEATTEHQALLLGITPETECYYRVVVTDGENAASSDIEIIETGTQPLGLPKLDQQGEGHDQYTIVPLLGQTKAVTIINTEGKYVWYHIIESELDHYRVRLSGDGKSLLYNAGSVSGNPADNSEIVRISLDGLKKTSIPIQYLAHDFVELPDGTLAALVVEYRDFEGAQIRGDKIVEVSPDGTQTTVWSVWDCFNPATDQGDDIEHGWTFANALDYEKVDDSYYLGMRNFSSIVKINRSDFSCQWILGSTASTIAFSEGTSPMMHQHQFEMMENSIVVFDNEGLPGKESRVIEYEIDLESNEAKEIWSYSAEPTIYTFVLGDVSRLEDGDTLVNWSVAGRIERVAQDGSIKWQLSTPMGYAFGFHTIEDNLYVRSSINH